MVLCKFIHLYINLKCLYVEYSYIYAPTNQAYSTDIVQGDLEPDEDPMENFEDPVYDESLFDDIPEDFKDFSLEKIVRTPIHLENFRQFLQVRCYYF